MLNPNMSTFRIHSAPPQTFHTTPILKFQDRTENPSKENPSLILDKEKKDEGKHDILVLRSLHTTTPVPTDPSETPSNAKMQRTVLLHLEKK